MGHELALVEGQKRATILPLLDCNARCPFCSTRVYTEEGVLSPSDYQAGNFSLRAKQYTQSLEEVKRTCDELRAGGVTSLNIQGGEPTMWEPLPELLAYGRQIGFEKHTIVSNGRRFKDAEFTKRLIAAEPDTIVLSLFGAKAETHDESMGVRGAFEDVVAGVKNLVAATQAKTGKRTSIMAQFSMHARNFRELPEMVRFWHGLGLRDFYVRLLRETMNTSLHKEQHWFFDLAELKAPLEQALDVIQEKGDAIIFFSEMFFCLVSPSYLGFILRDLEMNASLRTKVVAITKHHTNQLRDRRLLGQGDDAICSECQLRPGCLRLEPFYHELYKGQFRSIQLAPEILQFLDCPISEVEARRLQPMLELDDSLEKYGLTPEQIAKLWRNITRQVTESLPMLLLPGPGAGQLRRSLEHHRGRSIAVRMLKLSELPGQGPLGGDHRQQLPRLAQEASSEARRQLEFLEAKAECLVSARTVMVFGYLRRTAAGDTLTLVPLYDDARVDEETVLRLLAPFVEALRGR